MASRIKLSSLATQFYERYVRFSEQLHNTWVHFETYAEVLNVVEKQCQDEAYNSKIVVQSTSPINSDTRAPIHFPGSNLAGVVRRAYRKEIPELVLLNSVSLFEAFVSDIARLAYIEYPERYLLREMKDSDDNDTGSEKENLKLLRILVSSTSREEAIEKYVEGKLRGIFYGNPVDVFRKNKLGFNIQDVMANCAKELDVYAEITARRNVIMHNLGIIDQKYIREVKNAALKPGDKAVIGREYLFQALQTLNTLAKIYVVGVTRATTGESLPHSRIGKIPVIKSKTTKSNIT